MNDQLRLAIADAVATCEITINTARRLNAVLDSVEPMWAPTFPRPGMTARKLR